MKCYLKQLGTISNHNNKLNLSSLGQEYAWLFRLKHTRNAFIQNHTKHHMGECRSARDYQPGGTRSVKLVSSRSLWCYRKGLQELSGHCTVERLSHSTRNHSCLPPYCDSAHPPLPKLWREDYGKGLGNEPPRAQTPESSKGSTGGEPTCTAKASKLNKPSSSNRPQRICQVFCEFCSWKWAREETWPIKARIWHSGDSSNRWGLAWLPRQWSWEISEEGKKTPNTQKFQHHLLASKSMGTHVHIHTYIYNLWNLKQWFKEANLQGIVKRENKSGIQFITHQKVKILWCKSSTMHIQVYMVKPPETLITELNKI